MSKIIDIQSKDNMLFEPLNSYCKETYGLLNLFAAPSVTKNSDDIMVVELFAGVGGCNLQHANGCFFAKLFPCFIR